MTQVNIKGDILEEKLVIQNSVQSKNRGTQKARVRGIDKRSIMRSDYESVKFKRDTHFKLASGNLISGAWIDMYQWCAGGTARKQWNETLARTATNLFSGVDKATELAIQW